MISPEARSAQITNQPVNTGEVTPRHLQETFREQIQKAREKYPMLAQRVQEANLPSNIGNLILGLATRWAEKSPGDIARKAAQLNQQIEHPAIKGLDPIDLQASTNDPLELKRETTSRLVRFHVQQELQAMNGTGPAPAERPLIIKTAGELAKDVVDHVGGQATTMARGVAYSLIHGDYRTHS
jgi:hypothetical protein